MCSLGEREGAAQAHKGAQDAPHATLLRIQFFPPISTNFVLISGVSVKLLSSPSHVVPHFSFHFSSTFQRLWEPNMRRKTFPIWDEESACLQLPRNSRAAGLTKAIINGQLRSSEQRDPTAPSVPAVCPTIYMVLCIQTLHNYMEGKRGESINTELKLRYL